MLISKIALLILIVGGYLIFDLIDKQETDKDKQDAIKRHYQIVLKDGTVFN